MIYLIIGKPASGKTRKMKELTENKDYFICIDEGERFIEFHHDFDFSVYEENKIVDLFITFIRFPSELRNLKTQVINLD